MEPGESQPAEPTDDAEARAHFWSIQGDFICRHHIVPRVQLYVSKEETFPVPLKYIHVKRYTWTDLDVMQEKRIDDYWNVDSSKPLSDSWRRFTKFTLLKAKPLKGQMWSRRRLTKIQATTRPDYVWPEVWTKMGKAAQNRERQEWAKEKPKLDNPDDKQCAEIRKKNDEKIGKTCGSRHAVCKRNKHRESECQAENWQ